MEITMNHITTCIVDKAIRWAEGQLDSTEYTTLCYKFLEDAYEFGNGIILDGKGTTAMEAAAAYGISAGEPPRGSYVFYDCSGPIDGKEKNYGHIGLALGDGKVIHAWDKVRVDGVYEIEKLQPAPGWTSPVYLGWASPELILVGMKLNIG